MKHLTEEDLIDELKSRFAENRKLMSELKKVNKKLEESEILKTQFLSNIRNEINNPFVAILGLSQNILCMDENEFDKSRQTASMIYQEAFKLDYQLRNIFAAAELEAGELFPEIREVNLHRLLQETEKKLRHKADKKNISLRLLFEVTTEVEEAPSFLFFTDADMLGLMLNNLISNAIEFSKADSVVYISTVRKNQGISIVVRDHGIGISAADQQTIFDRFAQLDQGAAKQFQGHGLGLSVSKALAELLNGSLSVLSEENAGSVFTLWLPEETSFLEGEGFSTNEDGIFL